jgi:2-aminoadipate transaminase
MLVALAQKHGFLIVEDSPYRELRYEGEHIPTMYSLDPDHVIHLGSFSKIFAPGFRLGWAIAHPDILDKIYVCKQSLDLCPPIFDQYVAAEFLSSGRLDSNLEKSIALYKDKRDHLLNLLAEYMPAGIRWTHPEGGLFLFLTMPEGFEAVKFYDKSLDVGVAYVAGEFFHPDGSGKNTMRMNFSFMTKERMTEGVKILAELLKDEIL